jgi:hypothetical protein
MKCRDGDSLASLSAIPLRLYRRFEDAMNRLNVETAIPLRLYRRFEDAMNRVSTRVNGMVVRDRVANFWDY